MEGGNQLDSLMETKLRSGSHEGLRLSASLCKAIRTCHSSTSTPSLPLLFVTHLLFFATDLFVPSEQNRV